jgi:hypothetical protein
MPRKQRYFDHQVRLDKRLDRRSLSQLRRRTPRHRLTRDREPRGLKAHEARKFAQLEAPTERDAP